MIGKTIYIFTRIRNCDEQRNVQDKNVHFVLINKLIFIFTKTGNKQGRYIYKLGLEIYLPKMS